MSAAPGAVPPASADDISLLTCSFRGDLEACRILCESIDRFVPREMRHTLIVPTRDLDLFAPFAGGRRAVVSEDLYLPRAFFKLPMPPARWRRLLHLPRRNIYLTPYSKPVRGWIAQQMIKIAAAAAADTEVVVHVDSDNAFIRPVRPGAFVRDGRARLLRIPKPAGFDSHVAWHRAAGRLLGLPPSDFHGAEYIDALVVWRRSVARALTAHIAQVTGLHWTIALSRTPHFAEYVLYGVFADRVLGLDAAGLFAAEHSLCHALWTGSLGDDAAVAAFVDTLEPDRISCLIQSTIDLDLEARGRIFAAVEEKARAQDAAAAPA